MISQETIDAIFQSAHIEEVVEDYVQLTKRGVNLKGLCPFHDDKTPSFTVSPTRNIYKCFGCGKGGNSVNFLMEHEGLSYPEALRSLARKYNIPIEETQVPEEYEQERQERDSLFLINEFAKEFYKKQLFETDLGKSIGLSYFKDRGLLYKTLEAFGLGFAPGSRDAFTKNAIEAGYNIEFLRKLGLTTDKDRDFFYNRVIFPIHNIAGKVVAFAGRHLTSDKKSPKYINSKESEIYHKSRVLYGLHLAKSAIRKEEHCLLVEGYTDVISLHQSGVQHVVASSGTALTADQVKLIKRYTTKIKILYDGDPAGIKAAMRGIDLILEQDMNVELVLFPQGEDPDSFIKSVGVTAFKEYLDKESQDFILFKTNLILSEAGNDPMKKAGLIKDIIESLAHIPDTIKRSVYTRQCSELLKVDEHILVTETNKVMSKRLRDSRINKLRESRYEHDEQSRVLERDSFEATQSTAKKEDPGASDEYQERDIIRVLILYGDRPMQDGEQETSIGKYILSNIQEAISAFDNKLYARIATEYGLALADGKILDTNYFTQHPDPDVSALAIEFCASPYEYSDNWQKMWDIRLQTQPMPDENEQQDSMQALNRFFLRKYKKMSATNLEQIKAFQESGDTDSLLKHLQVQNMLIEKRNEIANKLNTVIL
ncbi:MAG: DNA primase [Saprospiraceae bacterium]|nr:DNA primase [Saprospiraceae bacterium]